MTSTGMAAAKSAIRSASPRAARPSSNPSTKAASPACMPAMARGVSAPAINRRTRLCRGGSLNTRLVVWCSYNGVSPNFGRNSTALSLLKV